MAAQILIRMRSNLAETRARWSNRRFMRLVPPLGREWLAYLALALASIAFAAYFLDAASVPWANALPASVREVGFAITDSGKSGWVLYPAGVVILVLLAGDWDRVPRPAKLAWAETGAIVTYLFIAVGGSGIAANIIKSIVGRARPRLFETTGGFGFDPFVVNAVYASFPSGHSTTWGAVAVVGAIVFPRWRWPIIVVTVLLASTRVVVGAHYPSDVVAGFLLGAAFAYLLARYFAGSGYAVAIAGNRRIVARTGAIRRQLSREKGSRLAWRGLASALKPT